MKNSSFLSAIVGGAFFAVPYLGLSVGIIPSLALGAGAFGASELIFSDKRYTNKLKNNDPDLYEKIITAKETNTQIAKMVSLIEDKNMQNDLIQIHDSVEKIISVVEKKPEKYKKVKTFFDYYLPVTINILRKYDEIENQRLISDESKDLMKSTQNMVKKINDSFKMQLSALYQDEIIDVDAEMKVIDSMLKSEGLDDNNIKVKKEEENEE